MQTSLQSLSSVVPNLKLCQKVQNMSSEKRVTFAEENEEKPGRFKGKHSLDSDEESDGQAEGNFVEI
jgi:hypothetical protein